MKCWACQKRIAIAKIAYLYRFIFAIVVVIAISKRPQYFIVYVFMIILAIISILCFFFVHIVKVDEDGIRMDDE